MAVSRAAAVFLDKDGTLVEDVPYNVDPERIRFLPGVAEGLRMLAEEGFRLAVVSNQPGIALGYFSESALEAAERRLNEMFEDAGARLEGFYYCPHDPKGTVPAYAAECNCRKPLPGLIQRAAGEMKVALRDSWMIGDILNDVEAGNAAGVKTVFINNGHETEWQFTPRRLPDLVAEDFEEAAAMITGKREPVEAAHVWPKRTLPLSFKH